MLRFTEQLTAADPTASYRNIPLTHDQRRRSRTRVVLADSTVIGIFMPRGTVLRDGDLLRAEDGSIGRIVAAPEHVSVAETADAHLLTRAAYHLGNRHVPLQVEPSRLVYPHDHVLDGMVRELGLTVSEALAPFEPEAGGYSGEHKHSLVRGGHGHAGHAHGDA